MTNEEERKVGFFYVDESWIYIEGKRHLMVGAITSDNLGAISLKVAELKLKLGIGNLEEIKWNMNKQIPMDLKYKISDGMLNIISHECTGFIVITECNDKDEGVKQIIKQIYDYCVDSKVEGYTLFFDNNLIQNQTKIKEYITTEIPQSPICLGFQSFDSSNDNMIQCCDIFIGIYRTAIDRLLNNSKQTRIIYDESLGGEVEFSLVEYFVIFTRYVLWGETDIGVEELLRGELPNKISTNLGFRIDSTISSNVKKRIENEIATVYIGCMH